MKILLLIFLSLSESFTQWSLSLSTTEILQVASYTFSLKLSKAVSSSYYLQVTFPNNYTESSIKSLSCSSVFQLSPTLKCSTSGLSLTLTSLYKSSLSAGSTIIFKLNGISNLPYAGSSSSFKIVSFDRNGGVIEGVYLGLLANFTTKALDYFNISPTNKTVGALSTWILSSSLNIQVLAGATVSIDFPLWNSNYSPKSEEKIYFLTENPECVLEYNLENTTQACEFKESTFKLNLNITVSGIFKIFIDSGLTPPSTQQIHSINVSLSEPAGALLSYKNASVSSETPCLLTPTISLSSESLKSKADYTLSLTPCGPVDSKTSIKLEFPSEFSLTLTNTLSIFGLDLVYPTSSISGQVITLTNLFTSYKAGGKFISFKLIGLTNPSKSYVEGLKISVLHNGYLSGQSRDISISYASGNLLVNKITATNTKVNENSSFLFSLTPDSTVPVSAVLYIKISVEIKIPEDQAISIEAIEGISNSALILVNGENTIQITQGFSEPRSGTISFNLLNLTNPESTKPTSPFVIRIYKDANKDLILFQNSSVEYSAESGELKNCFIEPGSLITGETTEYTFGCNGNLYVGGSFIVELPDDCKLVVTSSQCFGFIGFDSEDYCENTERIIKIYSFQGVTGEFSMKISNIKNPISTNPVVFNMHTYTSDGFLVETTSFSVIMNETHEFKSISIEPDSKKVSEVTFYTLKISLFNEVSASGWLIIESSLDLSKSSCQSPFSCEFSKNLKINLNQFKDSYTIIINNIQNQMSLKPSSFKITSYDPYSQDSSTLYYSLSTPGDLSSIKLTPNNGLILAQISCTLNFNPQHPLSIIDSLIIQFPLTYTDLQYNSINQLNNKITVLNPTLPITFSFTLPAPANTHSLLIQTLKDSYLVDQSSTIFTVNCLTPCSNCSTSPTTCTKCSEPLPYLSASTCLADCPVGESDIGNKICSPCSLGCKECLNFDVCQQCTNPYNLESGSCVENCPYPKFAKNNECQPCSSQCLTCLNSNTDCTSCPTGKYLYHNTCVSICKGVLINSVCFDCDSNCKTCGGSIKSCTSCESGYLFDSKCYESCPEGSMKYEGNCVECETDCKSCSEWVNKCTSCYEGSTLISSSCISTCDQGYFYDSGTCLQCSSLCKSCQNTAEYCTSCVQGFAYKGNCLESCPSSLTIQSDTSCIDCLPTCETCSLSISNCLTCSPFYTLFNNSCLSSCPEQYYNESNICVQCPEYCNICNESECFSCNPNTFKHNKICVETCPLGYYSSGDECLICEGSCLSCNITSELCTDCESPLFLLDNMCLNSCPDHFVSEGRRCVEIKCGKNCTETLLKNDVCDPECDFEECEYDNKTCKVKGKSELKIDKEPFSFTTAGVVIGGIGGTAAVVSTGSVLASISPVCGVLEFAGWVAVGSELMENSNSGRRRLSEDYNEVSQACFIGILIIVVLKVTVNFVAIREYSKLITGVHRDWVQGHYKFSVFIRLCSGLVSFKLLSILVSGICGWSIFSAKFEQPSRFFKILLGFTAFSLIFLSIPMLCICLYILSIFPQDSLLYILTADVFIITVLSILISILSIFKYFKQIKLSVPTTEMVSVAVPTAFEDIDFTSENSKPAYEDRYTIIKQYLNNLNTFEKQTIKKNLTKSRSLDLSNTNKSPDILAQSFTKSKLNESFDNTILELPSIIINQSEQGDSELSISSIELEIKPENNFEFLEIDPEDFEIVRVKFKDIESVLCLRKSFDDGVFVDENRVLIEKQPKVDRGRLELVRVCEENPAVGIFRDKESGEIFRILRCFSDAQVVKDRRKGQNYEFVLNSRRELVEKSEVKQGHPLFWKFEDPRVKYRDD